MIRGMAVTYSFAGLAVTDFATAYDWYARLLGRPADMRPHEAEAVWRLTSDSAIYVVQDPQRSGNGLVTLALDDLDAHERSMRESGFPFTEELNGDSPRRLVVRDLDGNNLTFFQDPARPPA
jgi:catechol 2,3-dioxygenase-like lactoylglutathione lyase family enzyme